MRLISLIINEGMCSLFLLDGGIGFAKVISELLVRNQ